MSEADGGRRGQTGADGASAPPGRLAVLVLQSGPLSPSLGLIPHQRAMEEIAHQVHLYPSFQLCLFVFACFT